VASRPPLLANFTVSDAGSGVADLAFKLTDKDDDLGHMDLLVDGVAEVIELPEGLDQYVEGGISHHLVPVPNYTPGCGRADAAQFVVQAWDLEGNSSEAAAVNATFAGGVTGVSTGASVEPNETLATATNLGVLAQEATITGTFDDSSDDEWLLFTVCESGTYTFRLSWAATSTYLYMYLKTSTQSTISSDYSYSGSGSMSGTLKAGKIYYLSLQGGYRYSTPDPWELDISN
jgi:hypothetical protein